MNRNTGKTGIGLLLPFILVLTFLSPHASAEHATQKADQTGSATVFTFSIVPQQTASKLAKLWTPILQYLTDKTGYLLQFKTAKNIPTFEQRLAAGEYDFAYMNPYHYTVFHQSPGYEALAKARNKRIKGIVVVKKDSPFTSLEQLQGHDLAFPSPAAFAASILTQSEFHRRGIDINPKYVSSHDSVYRNVALGRMSAGGGVVRTLKNVAPEVSEQLKVLWTTAGYTPHAIAVHPRIEQDVVQRIRQAIVNMEQDPQGTALLDSIEIQGFETAQNADWDDVRSLGIKLLK